MAFSSRVHQPKGTSGRAGARSGPNGIRQASAHLRWEEQRWPWPFRLQERLRAIDYGDIQFSLGDSDDMLPLLRGLAGLNIVGFDVVEVSPAYDKAQLTTLAGATLALEFLYLRASRRSGSS